STASVRTGPAIFCSREGVFAPGAGAPTARWCPGRTSTSSSAIAGVAHLRWNSHLGIEAFQLGCAFFFGFAALALDDHADGAPQGFAAPLVAGAAEEAGVEVVEGFFELQVVVAQADEPFTVLLPGPELQRLAGFGGAVGAAGGLQVGQGIALFLIVELLLGLGQLVLRQGPTGAMEEVQAGGQRQAQQGAGKLPGPEQRGLL